MIDDSFINSRRELITQDHIRLSYESELRRFSEILATPSLVVEIEKFINGHERTQKKGSAKKGLRLDSNLPPIINLSKRDVATWKNIAYSQIPVCCELFQGASVSEQPFDVEAAKTAVARMVEKFFARNQSAIDNILSLRIPLSDAFRVVYLLKSLGLIRWRREGSRQLSLGAGTAAPDVSATHGRGWLQREFCQTPLVGEAGMCLKFHIEYRRARHTVLIDGDPALEQHYDRVNLRYPREILAINEAIERALPRLARAVAAGDILARNIVLGYRIDHRMISDVARFFALLGSVITGAADLVLTIGAGDSPEDFSGRLAAFDVLEEYLRGRELRPVRIRMFRSDELDLGLRWGRPLFGLPELSSYEILYCKLKREKL